MAPNPSATLQPHAADHAHVTGLRRRLIELARADHRLPIGTDMVLHEQADPAAVMLDGKALGRVMIEAADRYHTPIALSLMDLRLEKSDLLQRLGVADEQTDTFHFDQAPSDDQMAQAAASDKAPFDPRGRAHLDAIRYVVRQGGERITCGMAIGPFSLATKLMADPITAVALAGMGMSASDEPDVAMVERVLELACGQVHRSLAAQIEAGADAVCVCEPAANVTFLSPNMIAGGSDVFERFVMGPNEVVARQLNDAGVGLIFHDCGELIDDMVRQFAHRLHPVMLSLGSSRVMWHDAELVPDDVVLYGNLPSKRFYSDADLPIDAVESMTRELAVKMKTTGKPFILGTECDVLSVAGSHDMIAAKVDRMLGCSCH
ncbi:hypothetical protein HED60_13260 [Planctomycetales bacterium ZRK34]|nr:hypothetical protein HED60_13260 [Planctomycetales bacterium ZRK34]